MEKQQQMRLSYLETELVSQFLDLMNLKCNVLSTTWGHFRMMRTRGTVPNLVRTKRLGVQFLL